MKAPINVQRKPLTKMKIGDAEHKFHFPLSLDDITYLEWITQIVRAVLRNIADP